VDRSACAAGPTANANLNTHSRSQDLKARLFAITIRNLKEAVETRARAVAVSTTSVRCADTFAKLV
jgi:hypothetical protein